MYILKLEPYQFKELIKRNKKTQTNIAEIIGVHRTYISQIVNGRGTSKLCAYAICKSISPDLELNDLFIKL